MTLDQDRDVRKCLGAQPSPNASEYSSLDRSFFGTCRSAEGASGKFDCFLDTVYAFTSVFSRALCSSSSWLISYSEQSIFGRVLRKLRLRFVL